MNDIEYCPFCGADIEEVIGGSFKGQVYYEYYCTECSWSYSEEPDWDSMKDGYDYEKVGL